MHNDDFYVTAATVIPLLLIALIATRSFRPGEMGYQPIMAVLTFGLPLIGELAAFSFLFASPVSTPDAVVFAVVTWAGLLSELALAAWWGAELVRRDVPSQWGSIDHGDEVKPLWLCQFPGCNYRIKPGSGPHLCPQHRGALRSAQTERRI
jgi:hypothetical protein